MALVEGLLLLTVIFGLIYLWCRYNYSYWQRKGIPYAEPTYLIGNMKEALLRKTSYGLHLSDIYNKPEFANEPVVGMYALHVPGLVIRDLELLKSIFIKDFNKFSDRFGSVDMHVDKLGAYSMFFVRNPQWKELRHKLSPVFTSGKTKQMYPLMQEVGLNLEKQLEKQSKGSGEFQVEVKELSALFTTDLIATIAFGIDSNSLANPNAEFRVQGKKMMTFTPSRGIDALTIFFMPKVASLLRRKIFTKEYTKFLRELVGFVMAEREKSGATRNDLIDTLVALKREAAADKTGQHIAEDFDYLVSQAGIFYTAGFETASSTIAFALYEMAKNPDVQKRLREEIKKALEAEKNDKLSYEKITSLEYLNMVLDETLRLYPIMPFLDRKYKSIPGEKKFSLRPHHDFELEDGTPVYIPAYAIQRDPKYWPNPEVFDPERFSPENKKTHHPMSYIPFGSGPHNCIGMRLGLLQAKLGLFHYLKNYVVSSCPETVETIKFNVFQPTLQCEKPIHLKLTKDPLYVKQEK